MNWLADNYGSMAAVDDPAHAPALAFTASDMEGWTPDDYEAAALAMDRDVGARLEDLRRENAALASDNEWLREQLRNEQDGEHHHAY